MSAQIIFDFFNFYEDSKMIDQSQYAQSERPQSSNGLIPVTKWNQYHPWPPLGGLRHLIFNAKTNGFDSAFKRVGRRVLVDEREFFAVIDRNNGGA
jgi:hypothetical protein